MQSLNATKRLINELEYNNNELQRIQASTSISLRDEEWKLISGAMLHIPDDLLKRIGSIYMNINSAKSIHQSIQSIPPGFDLMPEMLKIEKHLSEIKEAIPDVIKDLRVVIEKK